MLAEEKKIQLADETRNMCHNSEGSDESTTDGDEYFLKKKVPKLIKNDEKKPKKKQSVASKMKLGKDGNKKPKKKQPTTIKKPKQRKYKQPNDLNTFIVNVTSPGGSNSEQGEKPDYVISSEDEIPMKVSINLAAKSEVDLLKTRVDDLYKKFNEFMAAQTETQKNQSSNLKQPIVLQSSESSANNSPTAFNSPMKSHSSSISIKSRSPCYSIESDSTFYSPPRLPPPFQMGMDENPANFYVPPAYYPPAGYYPYCLPPLEQHLTPKETPPKKSTVTPNSKKSTVTPNSKKSTVTPNSKKSTLKPNSKKSIVTRDCSSEHLITVRAQSCSRGNFATNLMRDYFNEEERLSSNVRGKNDKPKLSPNRIDMIRKATLEMFPLRQKETQAGAWGECIRAIDGCNRTFRKNKRDVK